MLYLSNNLKEKKRNINIDLAVLPSHDKKVAMGDFSFANILSQTSFSHISINSSTILMVLKATESPQKDLLIIASYISRQSILAEILSRSTGNCHDLAKMAKSIFIFLFFFFSFIF